MASTAGAGAKPRGRRGRRGTVCAPPVMLEAGWKPKVVAKSLAEKARICEVVANNILFAGLDDRDRDVIVDAMEEKSFSADDVIIKQGDVGDFFYVLDTGATRIEVNGKKVAEVGTGGSFGELALMYNAPRAATVIATEPCRCWAVDQLTFKKTLMATTTRKRQQHEGFIKGVPILSSLEHYERLTIADALQTAKFASGEVAITEGDEGNTFYIVESGEFKVTKSGVAGEVSQRLTAGTYFGERALITNDKRAATVTAVKDSVCQSLDRKTFKRLLGPLQDIMVKNMSVYEKYKDSVDAASKVDDEDDEEEDDEDDEDATDGKDADGDDAAGAGGAGGGAGATTASDSKDDDGGASAASKK